MQRSLINELKGASSTLINSTLLPTASQLRLPPEPFKQLTHHAGLAMRPRADLSKQLDFLVVFQAVEIERLSRQLTGLRWRVKEVEGLGLHQTSYEVQIRELMERCSQLQTHNYALRQELAQARATSEPIFHELTLLQARYAEVDFCAAEKYKLEKTRNEELMSEIERWKGRYSSLERAKADEQGMRRTLQGQREERPNQSKQLAAQFEEEREQLLSRLRQRKEQLDMRELQLTKLQNCYQQLQVRSRQEAAKVDSYEEKVAMLSQETYRLSELLRVKTDQIRSLKLTGEQDHSLRMSTIHSLDETRLLLNERLQATDHSNQLLRQQMGALEEQNVELRHRLTEHQRVQMQLREAREENESRLRALERKDKKIMGLEEDIRQASRINVELKELKVAARTTEQALADVKQRLDAKIEELRQAKQQQINLIQMQEELRKKVESAISEFSAQNQMLLRQNAEIRNASQASFERSAAAELKAKEYALQLKEKDYRITSLQNQLKQHNARLATKEVENRDTIQQLEATLFTERRNFQARLKDAQASIHRIDQLKRQVGEAENRYRQAEAKIRQYQASETRARSLEVECNELEQWGRSLEMQNEEMNIHIRQLERQLAEREEDSSQARQVQQQQNELYRLTQLRYYQTVDEMKALRTRLDNIERILASLKTTVSMRIKNAKEENIRLQTIEERYEQLYQWFISVSANYDASFKDSPSKAPYHTFFSSQATLPTLSSPSHRLRSPDRSQENYNSGNQREDGSLEAVMRHVLLCVEVESLRKRVGDKNAKVQSMRNSIVKGHSHSHTATYPREISAGKKTIYY